MNIIWFRRDLRLSDNPALTHAIKAGNTVALFVDYEKQYDLHDESEMKINFLRANLNDLKSRLQKLDIPTLVFTIPTFKDIITVFEKLCQQHSIEKVFFNKEYLVDECERDELVANFLSEQDVETQRFDANYIHKPNYVSTNDDKMYKVFTPYKKSKIKRMSDEMPEPLAFPDSPKQKADVEPSEDIDHTYENSLWPVGEKKALKQLKDFIQNNAYAEQRDYPGIQGTSQLSPYLAIGVVSARQCLKMACKSEEDALHSTWVSELLWRDFYRDLVVAYPHLCKHKPFKDDAMDEWQNDPKLIEAWKQGKTGFPIIDAGMRQLKQTGWMHNRVRMLVASFLTKLCLVDWRIGEKYFMQQLIDGDYASNNGGWQWSSATGADAAPYFRIFNPTTQSEKFDKKGTYISTHVPELAELNNKDIHNPSSVQRKDCDYPEPIIDYKQARSDALEWFKS